MTWIIITIFAYLLGAITVILDKYLLGSERISAPFVYAFYVGILGLGVLIFWPLGLFFPAFVLHVPSTFQMIISFISGTFFLFAITTLYFAIKKSEASKVTPVTFSIVPIITFFLAYLFSLENFSALKILGVGLLIFGGLFISFDLPLKLNKKKFFAGFYLSILAGILFGISTFTLKIVYEDQNFFNGYTWTRIGAFLGTLLLLVLPKWRKGILHSLKHGKKKEGSLATGAIFVSNKVIGGTSTALINIAIGMGSVTLVSSLISIQYVFVLIIAALLGKRAPHIFEEKLMFWDWAQRISAIFIITLGFYFIYL